MSLGVSMQFAIEPETGEKIQALPGLKAICPACQAEVVAKCGNIYCWHWAHVNTEECDSWSEGETIWHRSWKEFFFPDEVEVVMGPHRADIRTRAGRVIELQHSSISTEEIEERERFYGRGMVWVVDAEPFIGNLEFDLIEDGLPQWRFKETFRWKWERKSWRAAKRPVFLDLGEQGGSHMLFHVNKWSGSMTWFKRGGTRRGYGERGHKEDFLKFFGVEFESFEDRMKRLAQRDLKYIIPGGALLGVQ